MSKPKEAASAAQDSTVFRTIARVGYAVLGLLHIIIGVIAIGVATGGGGESASQSGAMAQIRETPWGVVLLWVVAVGLAALAIWKIAEAFLTHEPDPKKTWGKRATNIGTAIAYLAIVGTALVYALGGSSDSSEAPQSLSAQLLSTPGGVFLLALVGLVVAGVGVAFIVRGAGKKFEKQLDLPAGAVRTPIVTFGVVGYVAKGIAIGVVGILFIVAALTHNPEAAGGLDEALKSLTELPFGPIILWVVGLGLVLYGLFCFARARYAKM